MKTRNHLWATATAVFLLAFTSSVTLFGQNRKKIVPEHADIWDTTVTMSTSPDSKWVFITLFSKTPGQPIQNAFTIQYDNPPIATPIEFQGPAHVVATRHSFVPAPCSLWIEPRGQRGWMFRVDVYGGTIPKNADVEDPVGIAHYAWGPNDLKAPKSHQEFVDHFAGP